MLVPLESRYIQLGIDNTVNVKAEKPLDERTGQSQCVGLNRKFQIGLKNPDRAEVSVHIQGHFSHQILRFKKLTAQE